MEQFDRRRIASVDPDRLHGLYRKDTEIGRVFAYHGAEHKTINAFEAGVELTPEEVSKQSLVHPRCGTSFMLTLVLISVIIFTLVGPLPCTGA